MVSTGNQRKLGGAPLNKNPCTCQRIWTHTLPNKDTLSAFGHKSGSKARVFTAPAVQPWLKSRFTHFSHFPKGPINEKLTFWDPPTSPFLYLSFPPPLPPPLLSPTSPPCPPPLSPIQKPKPGPPHVPSAGSALPHPPSPASARRWPPLRPNELGHASLC